MGDEADSSKLVVVNCPDHHDKLTAGLWKFFTAQHRVDFFLQVGGRSVRAHQLILEVFLSLDKLTGQGATTAATSTMATHDHLERILEFLYNGRVAVRQDQLADLLRLARQLDFRMLADAVEATDTSLLVQTPTSPVRRRQRRAATLKRRNYDESSEPECETKRSVNRVLDARSDESSSSEESFRPDAAGGETGSDDDIGDGDCGTGLESTLTKLTGETIAGSDQIPVTEMSTRKCESRRRPIWKCKQCDYQSIRKALFQLHLSKHDPTVRTFKCAACAKPFACEVSLRRHKCSRTAERDGSQLDESGEGERGDSLPSTKEWTTSENEPAVYRCDECDYQCHVESFYLLHRAKHDSSIPVFRCASCPRKFLREESLRCHKCSPAYAASAAGTTAAAAPKTHVCQHCDYKTRDKYRFTIHASKHDPTVTVLRCEDCRKAFFSHEQLARHKQQHQTYRCTHCQHETQKSWRHYEHLFSVHGVNTKGETLAKLKCAHCDFSCRTEGLLKNHMVAKHSGEKPYQCDHCSFSSCHKSAIPQHIKIVHMGIRAHMCEECGYRAVSQSALNKHKLSHTGEKPFHCDMCEKKYSDITALKRHVGTHGQNEKPFICHICAYASNRRSNLNVHLRKVHKAPVEPPPFKYAPKSDYNLFSL